MLRIVRRSLAGHSKWANIRHKKAAKTLRKQINSETRKVIETSSKLAGGDRSHPALGALARQGRADAENGRRAAVRRRRDKAAGAGLEELSEGTLPGGVVLC